MPKVLVFDPSIERFVEKDVDDKQLYWEPLGGLIRMPSEDCIDQTSVQSCDIAYSVHDILNVACDMAKSIPTRYITDALFLAALNNQHKEIMMNLFNRDNHCIISFSQELANVINQQELVDCFNFEMSPLFIRQFEEADVIRRVRKADKLEMKDVLKAILYSQSEVGRLMLRYSISSQNIDSHCQE